MTAKIYIVRFTHSDSPEIENFEWGIEEAARDHFELFGIEDSDIYSRIDLIEHDWGTHTEKVLDSKVFPAG